MAKQTPAPPEIPQRNIPRYPGVQPFEDSDSHRQVFRARDKEKYELLQHVLAERIVILFSRSGLGKTSLINAGLLDPLRRRDYFPMVVRISGAGDDPLQSLYQGFEAAVSKAKQDGLIDFEPQVQDWNRSSLWHFFKSIELWRGNKLLSPVLVIDQFEELFTLHSVEARRALIRELAYLVRGSRPRDIVDPSGQKFSNRPPDIKVVLALREDFYANLQELRDRIPTIFKTPFRLTALTRKQASDAITGPAGLEGEQFLTPPFLWDEAALERVLDFLSEQQLGEGITRVGEEVEPFQLQLVCQYVEGLVKDHGLTRVTLEALGGKDALKSVLGGFYEATLQQICDAFPNQRDLRSKLLRLCERGLVTSRGRRLLREESTIQHDDGVDADVLRKMVELRLLRKEPRIGDNYYELTHDTLIEPIQQSRRNRKERIEEKARLRRTRLRSWIAAGAVVMTFGLGYWQHLQDRTEQRERLATEQARLESLAIDEQKEAERQRAAAEKARKAREIAEAKEKLFETKARLATDYDATQTLAAERKELAASGVLGAENKYAETLTALEEKTQALSVAKRELTAARGRDHEDEAENWVVSLQAEWEATRDKLSLQRSFLIKRNGALSIIERAGEELVDWHATYLAELDLTKLTPDTFQPATEKFQSADAKLHGIRQQVLRAPEIVEEPGYLVDEGQLDPSIELKLTLWDLQLAEGSASSSDAELASSYDEVATKFADLLDRDPRQKARVEDRRWLFEASAQNYTSLREQLDELSVCEKFDQIGAFAPARTVGPEYDLRQSALAELRELTSTSAVIVTADNFITTTSQSSATEKNRFRKGDRIYVRAWVTSPGKRSLTLHLATPEASGELGPPRRIRTWSLSKNTLEGVQIGYRQYYYQTVRTAGVHEWQLRNSDGTLICRHSFEVE